MGEPAKIVTVSYGAFSCRLEGFEDPVAIVRAIAGVFDEVTAAAPWFGLMAAQPLAQDRAPRPDGGHAAQRPDRGRPGRAVGPASRNDPAQPPCAPPDPDRQPDTASGALPAPVAPVPPRTPPQATGPLGGPGRDPEQGPERDPQDNRNSSPGVGPESGSDPGSAPNREVSRSDGPEHRPELRPGRHAERSTPLPPAPPEAAVDRLLRRTDDALAGDDARARHRLVGHLKAAVAATRAGEATGARPPGASAEMVASFRADLASAVAARPGVPRPDARATSTGTDDTPSGPGRGSLAATPSDAGAAMPEPTDAPPAPQRPQERAAAPGAASPDGSDRPGPPRTTAPLATQTPAEGFADFAARRGVHDLADVLEAAAAFATEVEGLATFTRQHVMQRAATAGFDAQAGREAGLRAFGRLLREERLMRAQRGMFALATGATARS
ncbi:hypothetical protein [Rhodobaculum claviforme]|uniref:Uncharacterized protein n=1 Tax=Rhodobaculum claviforme TaxID=1549854 RepID=A0A934TMD2_9RHOB|nr:hypothetical protein [Rhodobaculum claviforme]MBK5927822.1 hypothetical protein [Rhodobaculum claviforme]